MKTTLALALVIAALAAPLRAAPADATVPGNAQMQQKVLRYPFLIAETGFDPARVSDLYSRIITSHLFEALYKYDYLARPYKVVPAAANGMPQVSQDYRTWT